MVHERDLPHPAGIRRVSPVRHVLTLFGDYWLHVDEPLPTGSLIAALAELDIKEAAARATFSRMVRTDLLIAERSGRRTSHRVSPRAAAMIDEQARWIDSFGVEDETWDGGWSVVVFSVPETRRALRHAARSRLKWLGFAPLHDGMWVSPLHRTDDAIAQLTALGVEDVTVMHAPLRTSRADGLRGVWDLEAIAEAYRGLARTLASSRAADPRAAFAERMRLMLAWQQFRVVDVGIPNELAPTDWPRTRTRLAWAHRYNDLGPDAEARFRSFVAAISPELSELVTHRRTAVTARDGVASGG